MLAITVINRSSRRVETFAAAILGALLIAPAATAQTVAGARSVTCSSSVVGHAPYRYRKTITGNGISCREARQIIEAFASPAKTRHGHGDLNSTYWTLKHYPDWRCVIGAGGGVCLKGKLAASYTITLDMMI